MHGWVAVAGLALAACQPVPHAPVVRAAPLPPPPAAAGQHLVIDPAASRLELRVRAAGPLAPLGHAHVLQATGLEGEAWRTAPMAGSTVKLRFPVAGLVVDDPQARAAAGPDFARPVPEAARSGTREHLLGESQFDAQHYPFIMIEALAVGDAGLDAQVTVKDHVAPVRVPVTWSEGAGGLRARGTFTLSQRALGIEPYGVGGGALRVADEVEVLFDLVAR